VLLLEIYAECLHVLTFNCYEQNEALSADAFCTLHFPRTRVS